MKKSLLLIIATFATLVASAHDFEVGGIYYNITSETDHTAEVTYKGDDPYQGGWYSGSITIPATVTHNGVEYSVTSIGERAFQDCWRLTAITIPEGVTSIGEWAFYKCSSLTDIVVAEGNQTYDSRGGCNAIIETSSNTLIQGCSATIIPASVTSIGGRAFSGCSSLTAITIPESVTSIGGSAFSGCSSLTAITIPEGVTSFGSSAFEGCRSLTDITIPASVTSIGVGAFSDCSSLTAIIVEEGNEVYDSRNGCNAIIETNSNTLIQGCSTTIIPEGVTSIGERAFLGCSSLTAIAIPEGVTSIGELAFWDCSSLTDITLPEGVTSIGDKAFIGCSSLTAITLPEGVTSIGDFAFRYCSSLAAITIPEGVTSIGEGAFDGCRSLTAITIPEGVTSIGDNAFWGCSGLTAIIVEEGNEVYDSRNGCNAIIETNSNTLIQGCSTTIIPASVTSIGNDAFRKCESLTDITIPESVTWIASSAFEYCTSLTAITIPEGVTYIGEYAFYGCSSLTAITIPEGVASIGSYTFSGCSSLTTIVLPKSVEYIYSEAFVGCSELTDVYCNAETVPSTKADAFDDSYIEYATLHVPDNAVASYKTTAPWSSFGTIVSLDAAITRITLSASSATLTAGESLTLTITTTPEDADRNLISWSSSNPSVATVDNTGKVTAIAPGTATITATATDGSGASASCKVEVVAAQQHSYTITFLVDGKVYHQESLEYGSSIVAPEAPTKEGYTFSGWSNVPETMPANNVTITGTFTVNKYVVTFLVDGEVYHQESLEYGSAIVVPEAPTKEGHTFSGWGEVEETVPAHDVTYEGSFSVNSYLLTYMVDGEIYLQTTVEYGSAIVAPEAPTKEGYTFSGWSNVPETMPANDVTVTGTFTAEEQPETEIIASGTCGDSLTWVLTEEYELVIEGTGAMYDYTANNVPWGDYRKSIQAVSLSEEMTSIGDYAFSNCTKLAAIAIPESVTSIGYRAFYRCSKLATVTITEESQLTSIGYAAFESCSNLTDITIPCGVTSIGEYAFFSCRKLTSITCYATTPPTIGGISTFYSVDKTIPVYVLDYTIAAYQSAKHWSEFTWFIGMETSINNSEIKNQKSDIIYDLHGRRITDTEGLKGIYIVNGRKVVIK